MEQKGLLVLRILEARQAAYRHVFDEKNVFLEALFNDLKQFCRAGATTFHTDPRVHAALEGRREVWLRIQDHLNLSVQELAIKYGGTNAISQSSDEH